MLTHLIIHLYMHMYDAHGKKTGRCLVGTQIDGGALDEQKHLVNFLENSNFSSLRDTTKVEYFPSVAQRRFSMCKRCLATPLATNISSVA
jgi:hypothetical protein